VDLDPDSAHGKKKMKKEPTLQDKQTSNEYELDDLLRWMPADDDGQPALAPMMAAGMGLNEMKPAKQEPVDIDTEDHDYIRNHCLVPTDTLKSFAQVFGARVACHFAEQYQPVSNGATRAISGLLLFGPSGTGKSLLAQAITKYINGTFYRFSMADIPNNSTAAARRIDALFDVAQVGNVPAVIFIDECDTVLSQRATARVGHIAGRFERFMDNLLVIGATNEPDKIAPKILTGRFERKIFVDNPSPNTRLAMIRRQLADESTEPALSPQDMQSIVDATAGRSAVNMERLISTAARHAAGSPVTLHDFEMAINEEPSDFDLKTARKNALFDRMHGWHPV